MWNESKKASVLFYAHWLNKNEQLYLAKYKESSLN